MKFTSIMIMILACCILFSGCAGQKERANSSASGSGAGVDASEQDSASASAANRPVSADFHDFTNWQWLEQSGETPAMVATEKKGELLYLNLKNEVEKTGVLDPNYLSDQELSYQVKWNSDYMVVLNQTWFVKVDGAWNLSNFSIHRHDGSLVKQFSPMKIAEDYSSILIDGKTVPLSTGTATFIQQAEWVSPHQLALYNNIYLFVLDLETGEITPVADFSELVGPRGKEGVYYGIQNIVANADGDLMYLAYDIEGKGNTLGTFYFCKRSDNWQTAIKGETFTNLHPYEDLAILQRFIEDPATGNTKETLLYYSMDGEVKPIATFPGTVNPSSVQSIPNGERIILEGFETGFYIYDLVDGALTQAGYYQPDALYKNPEIVTAYGPANDLTYIFSILSKKTSYLYHQEDREPTRLKNYVVRWRGCNYFDSSTHFVELNETSDGLRIVPIE